MKKGILFKALGGKNWIGGLYYIKNILYSISLNANICDKYNVIVYTEKENVPVFMDICDKYVIVVSNGSNKVSSFIDMAYVCVKYNIKYAFPINKNLSMIGITSIAWIPDFQHKHYPVFFTTNEIVKRDKRFKKIANGKMPVVLSSNDSNKDFYDFYDPKNSRIYVIHFVSYINKYLEKIDSKKIESIKLQYGIENKKYICIMNQFWPHKNHMVVLEALMIYYNANLDSGVDVVFTGNLNSNVNNEYLNKIEQLLHCDLLKNHIHMLGFIDREEQIAIMKNAEYIIQPSLFEGWGTVVEDAKVLDKVILLSDIPVHREQMNDNCILFDPHDPVKLAKLIEKENQKEHVDNVEKGIADMYKRAKEYSKGFEQLLKELERK